MLSSISPLGERARHNRWAVTVAWYVVASTVTAAAVGALLGAGGDAIGLSGRLPAALAASVGAVAAVVDWTGRQVPGPRRQVDEDWLGRYRGWVYGAGFGAQLGAGVTTIVTSATLWLTLVAEVCVATPAGGALVGATFGAVRAAPVVAQGRVRTYADLLDRQRRLAARAPVARWAAGGGAAAAAVAWAVLAVRP